MSERVAAAVVAIRFRADGIGQELRVGGEEGTLKVGVRVWQGESYGRQPASDAVRVRRRKMLLTAMRHHNHHHKYSTCLKATLRCCSGSSWACKPWKHDTLACAVPSQPLTCSS